MLNFDKLYEKWIMQVKNATSKEDLIIDSKAMRRKAESESIHVLNLDIFQKRAWYNYYQLESAKVRTGVSRKKQEKLDEKASAVNKNAKISVAYAKELRNEILREMGQNPKDFHIGHKEHGPAMDKARLLYDNAPIVDDISEPGITKEQKEMLRQIIYAQQAIERAKHSDILRVKKKLGLGDDATITDKVLIEYLKSIDEKISLNAEFLLQTKPNGPELAYEVEFEAHTSNSDSGALTSRLGTKLNKMLRIADKETMKDFKNSEFAKALMNVPGSKTFLQKTGRFISDLILGTKSREPRTKHTRKTTIENKRSARVARLVSEAKKAKRKAVAKIRRTKVEEPKVEPVGLFNVMGLINFILAKEIEAQMGKSSDPPTRLRYQTGRFAHSAKLLALKESVGKPTQRGAISPPLVGIYTYMHYPYDVFLPGRRLDNGQRNPKLYIEHGIRAAARTMLEGRFPGMVLESD